jgi:hypothetical protein
MSLHTKLNPNKKVKLPFINHPDFTITCIKKMEHTDNLMIRGFNNSEKPIKLTFTNVDGKPVGVDILNLKEKMLKQNVKIDTINKYEIRTYRLTTALEDSND